MVRTLESFLKYNDAYAKSAHLTLALHSNAAVLWRLPWEYIHDGHDFLALHGKFQTEPPPLRIGRTGARPHPAPAAPAGHHLIPRRSGRTEHGKGDQRHPGSAGRGRTERPDPTASTWMTPRWRRSASALKSFNPHVMHYTGHGIYREDKAGAAQQPQLSGPGKGKRHDAAGRHRRAAPAPAPRPRSAPGRAFRLPDGADERQRRLQRRGHGHAGKQAFPPWWPCSFRSWTAPASIWRAPSTRRWRRGRAWPRRCRPRASPSGSLRRGRATIGASPPSTCARRRWCWWMPSQDLAGLRRPGEVSSPSALINIDGLPLPRHFVGRKRELRQLRRALRDNQTKSAFIRGIGGMGKSSLAAKLAQRPGTALDGILVIRCHEVDALDIPGKIAGFLQAQGVARPCRGGQPAAQPDA